MNDLADKNFDSIKLKLLDEVFLLADESEIDGKNFINILAGSLNCPSETFLIVCKEIQTAPNASLMVRAIDDAVQKIGIKRENFSLLINDAANDTAFYVGGRYTVCRRPGLSLIHI